MPVALALAGAIMLWLPAFRFRIDSVTVRQLAVARRRRRLCARLRCGGGAACRRRGCARMRSDWSLGRALGFGALVHAVAMVAPPFASNDPLFYAAIGRSMARFGAGGGDAAVVGAAAGRSLPGDAAPTAGAAAPAPTARSSISSRASSRVVGGDDLTLTAPPLSGAQPRRAGRGRGAGRASVRRARRGAPAVRAARHHRRHGQPAQRCPVGAGRRPLRARAVAPSPGRRRRGAGGGPRGEAVGRAAAGIRAAAAGAAAAGRAPARRDGDRDRRHPRCRRRGHAGGGAARVAEARRLHRDRRRSRRDQPALLALVGGAAARAVHLRAAPADGVVGSSGSLFRAASGVWILYCRLSRAPAIARRLAWAATALFVYYLFLHAFLQAWYLLPLLPLADPAAGVRAARRSACSSSA